jgi:hypothetical protein
MDSVGSIYKQPAQDGLAQIAKDAQVSETEENKTTAQVANENLQVDRKQEETDTSDKNLQAAAKKNDRVKANTTTINKAKQAGQARTKLLPVGEIKEFLGGNKYSPKRDALDDLQSLVHDGMSKEEILALIKSKFPKPEDAHLAFEFLTDISTDELKEAVKAARGDYITEENKQRIQVNSDKVASENPSAKPVVALVTPETEALAKQASSSLEAAIKFMEHIISNPIEAPALYKLIDVIDDPNVIIRECKILIHVIGTKFTLLKNLDDKDNKVEMKSTAPALKRVQALLSMEIIITNKTHKFNETLNGAAA